MTNTLGIRKFDFVEFYVGSAKHTAYWFSKALGMDITAYKGPETGIKDTISYFLSKNNLKFVVTSFLKPSNHEVMNFVNIHGDGVKRWAFEVDDVLKAYNYACENGAVPSSKPRQIEDEFGHIETASIKVYDDSEIVFINYDHYKGVFQPNYSKPRSKNDLSYKKETGLKEIDHIVGNVRINEMNLWVDYYNKIFDFERYIYFGPGDISTQYSSLLSSVVRSKDSVIKMPINEPYKGLRKSQIQEYIEEYNGTGVQHIAISTDNIIETISSLRNNGVEFLSVPDNYYDALREKNLPIKESIDDLQKHGILLDFEGEGYLLQLFTKPISDRPTFFFEIIQRREKTEGFGHGNFQALFESIEKEQELRGNLV
ncbi:MAG: 4-hydroxyphenylpyruvate dioxygenase [Candidatus Sericytochromatia bacterium]